MKRFFYSLVTVVTIIAAPLRADIDVQEVTSPLGFKAWLVEDHTIPFMSLRLGFKGGASLDRAGKRGSVNLMMALLEEGTDDLDARGFAREVDELAASFNFDASGDSVIVSARMLSENRDAAIALLKGAVAAPDKEASSEDGLDTSAHVKATELSFATSTHWDEKISSPFLSRFQSANVPSLPAEKRTLCSPRIIVFNEMIASE